MREIVSKLAKRKKDIFLFILACVAFCIISWPEFLKVIQYPALFQWDFKRYYFAGKLSLLGENPYDFGRMVSLFGDQLTLHQPFIYPPYTLIFFRPFSCVSLLQAYYLFFTLKLIMYVFLVTLWKRKLFKGTSVFYFALFILASMGSEAVYADLYTGNISVFQQVLFWAGIAFFLKKKMMASGICIVCASSVKFYTLGPLLLIFLAAGFWRHFLIFAGLLAALIAYVSFMSPAYMNSLVTTNMQSLLWQESGHIAISIRNLLRDIFSFNHLYPHNPNIFYAVIAGCIAASSLYFIARNRSFLRRENLFLVYFSIVSFALVQPILKDYEQVILIPPTYFLLDYFCKRKQRLMEFFLVLLYFVFTHHFLTAVTFFATLIGRGIRVDETSGILYFVANYHVLFALCVTWIVYVFVIEKEKKGVLTQGASPIF